MIVVKPNLSNSKIKVLPKDETITGIVITDTLANVEHGVMFTVLNINNYVELDIAFEFTELNIYTISIYNDDKLTYFSTIYCTKEDINKIDTTKYNTVIANFKENPYSSDNDFITIN
jgi:hypothetical protein